MLARYLHARLDILLCDTEHRYASHLPQAKLRAAAEAHLYLESLRKSITATDVEITTDAAFDHPLHEQVAHKVRVDRPTLVVKSADRHATARDSRFGWELIRSCLAPLLLTQGRPWHPRVRLGAVIDIVDGRIPDVSLTVAQVSANLRLACSADLDLLYAQPEGYSTMPQHLSDLARALKVGAQQLRPLTADASDALTQLVAEQEYDLVAMGVPDEMSFAGFDAGVSGHLLRSLRCDLLFVRPGSYHL
jgi:nucleotide-binding universal stress UspA family protein